MSEPTPPPPARDAKQHDVAIDVAINVVDVATRIAAVMLRDQHRLKGMVRRNDQRLAADLERAELRVATRTAAVPTITYPPQLPVSERRQDILDALRNNQVVVLAGDTGSGKSTQLPKLLLEAGRGVKGLIGHTQPRRLAARAVAERVAEELGSEVGESVGYAVRFTDKVSDRTLIKVMTDGILLAELQRDRDLLAYDALIIDEAHERSLNIDFLLGYLHQVRARRPDLQIVITSATIDTERFADHFSTNGVPAPIISVSGRTYPVDVRYRPYGDHPEAPTADDRDQVAAIGDAIDELCLEGPGDILVFLSGEREIRDTAESLRGAATGRYDILPLYARLSSADQHRIFAPHNGRRVVLSTNVAETSLTVPGIRYVVDAGTARISRFSRRLKVQRLPIEAVSQASANQRSGRCGRVAPGVAIRLFGQEDFESREAFTDPEILRTNLASVLLRMAAIRLGEVEQFGFVDPPDKRAVKDGVALLEELGAFLPGEADADKRLTSMGRRLSSLPIDPRLGRMILEANRLGCVREILIIVSALSIQDPRERPSDAQQKADEFHKRFADEQSDFIGWLNLWGYIKQQQKELSSSQFRKTCRAEYLNFLRIREWQDIHAQLRQALSQADVTIGESGAHADNIHKALLSGLLSQVGLREGDGKDAKAKGRPNQPKPKGRPMAEYLGARNAKFAVAPGSVLSRKGPAWVMAAELVETNRLWGRMVAGIEPSWAEEVGGHLCISSWSEPRFDPRQGSALITQRVTLFGLPIVTGRAVQLSRLDAPLARELFIRHGLAEGQWQGHHDFLKDLTAAKADLAELATRARRSDIEVAEDRLEQLFSEALPSDVLSSRTFEKWWKVARHEQPNIFRFTADQLQRQEGKPVRLSDYPNEWLQGDLRLPLSYVHNGSAENDGVTVHIPLQHLDGLRPDEFDWHIPGYRHELLVAILRCLPKDLRRELGPAPDTADAVLERVTTQGFGPFRTTLLEALSWLSGLETRPEDLVMEGLPSHLHLRFCVERSDGSVVAVSRDLPELQRSLRRRTTAAIGQVFSDQLQPASTTWTYGDLSKHLVRQFDDVVVNGYPGLVDAGKTGASVSVFSTQRDADRSHHLGVRRLLLCNLTMPMKQLLRSVGSTPATALALDRHGSMSAVLDDCVDAAFDQLIAGQSASVRNSESFTSLRERVRDDIFDTALQLAAMAGKALHLVGTIEMKLDGLVAPGVAHARHDVGVQVDRLVIPGFVGLTGAARLPDLLRYLSAAEKRLDTLGTNPSRDKDRTNTVAVLEKRYENLLVSLPREQITADVGQIRWMIEELRINLFAQQVGTRGTVSEKRILEAIAALAPR